MHCLPDRLGPHQLKCPQCRLQDQMRLGRLPKIHTRPGAVARDEGRRGYLQIDTKDLGDKHLLHLFLASLHRRIGWNGFLVPGTHGVVKNIRALHVV
jgi:hypothetical protein